MQFYTKLRKNSGLRLLRLKNV